MHRRGGKRIRMDDPPPEYVNPMTPATPMTEYGGQSVHEPETPSYSGFNVGAGTVANSTAVEPPREEADESHHEDEENRSPSPTPTKRVTRSRGRRGDGGFPGRLAESPPPPPVRRRGRGGRGRGRGRGAAPPPAYSPPPVLLPGDDENSLYNILRFNKTAINQVVDMWIEEYKTNREVALVQLMQFFINSSGCRGKVTPDMAQMDHTLIIKKMTQEFDEESGEYPLIMSGQTWKKFRSNFCEFIQTLVKMCQYSIIYDQYLMDNIISLLTGLSDSQVRAFRHTATLAVMKLMTALVDVALLTSVNCDNCLRQYEAERLKARDKRATERLEVLVAKRQELEENMEEIKNMLSYMFKSVFVHRYRDTLPEIRSITMSEIGNWMEKFPAHFLDDLYLKYIGWTLHDKVGEVRLRCLQALQPLYECDELKGKLELFTSKFKDRIVSMSLDKETEVAVHAVKLVIAILKMHPDVLTDKDCENVYELVYSSWRGVAAAAGEFLNVRLFQPTAAVEPLRSRRGKLRLPNTSLVRDLVQFFIESELHEHGAYLVDSLIESNPMMKDWECMTDLLLEEAGPGEEALDNRQESSLIELMVCCVRQASTGEPPVGRQATRKQQQLSKDQAKLVQEDRARMTAHFITTLPALLDKFGADPEKLTNLASIPMYMDLELYTTQRQEVSLRPPIHGQIEAFRLLQTIRAALTLLLNKLRDIVSVQTEAEVLETCGRALEYLCNDACAVYTRCNVARATITDMCVNRYKEAIDEYRTLIEGGETPDADEVFNVINSLRKVSIMYMCHNLNSTNIWESLFEDLPKCVQDSEANMPPQALVYVVRSLFYSVLWSLHAVEERAAAGAVPPAELELLRTRLLAYQHHCRDIVQHSPVLELKEEAYTSLCDLLIFFAEQLAIHHGGAGAGAAAVRALVLEPEPALLDMLNDFIQEYVFVQHNYDGQDERRIEELHKRRNFLAAYCKLIVYNVAPIRRAADVFKHYIKCYNDYGDIIKTTMAKAREINKLNCALTVVLAMQALFKEILARNPSAPPDLAELKELAKRFTVMFGLDPVKNREALTALHRAGIAFAALEPCPPAPPPHLHFLEPLAEFSNKLLRQDKRTVLKLLDSRIQHSVQWGEEWAPLTTYRNSLLTDAPDERPHARKHYTRRARHNEDEEAEENADSDAEQPGRSRRRVRLAVSVRRTRLPRRRAPPSPPTTASPSIHTSSQESARSSRHAHSRTATHTDTHSPPPRNLRPRRSHTHMDLRHNNDASPDTRLQIQKRTNDVNEMHDNYMDSNKSSSYDKSNYETRRSEIEHNEVRKNMRSNKSGSSVLSTENSLPRARKSGEDSDVHETNVPSNKSHTTEVSANKSASKSRRIITDFVEIHEKNVRSNKSSSSEVSTNKNRSNVPKNNQEGKDVSDSNASRKSNSSEISTNKNDPNLHTSNAKDDANVSNKPSSKLSANNNRSKPVTTNEASDTSDSDGLKQCISPETSTRKDSQKNRKHVEMSKVLSIEALTKCSKRSEESNRLSETYNIALQKRDNAAQIPTKDRIRISTESVLVASRRQISTGESMLEETPLSVNTKRKARDGNVVESAVKKIRMSDVSDGGAAGYGGRNGGGTAERDSEDMQFLSPSGSTASSECSGGGVRVTTALVHRDPDLRSESGSRAMSLTSCSDADADQLV